MADHNDAREVAYELIDPHTGWEQDEDEADEADVPPTPQGIEIPEVLHSPTSWLCGPAGTGKTTLAKAMVSQLPGTVLAATTGIAAVNLGEGTTINALLKYFDTASLRESWVSGHLNAILGKLWRSGTRRILLDEVSMMDAEQLTIIHRALREISGEGYGLDADLQDEIEASVDDHGQKGIALTLIGDFAQLSPVKAPYAFESPEWHNYAANAHKLTKIWRQDAQDFIGALMAIRRGEAQAAANYFAPLMTPAMDNHFDGSTIVATNDAVDRYNSLRMDQLSGRVGVYQTTTWGIQRGDWRNIPQRLGLKEGALVMILANLREPSFEGVPGALIYANGDLATVVAMDMTDPAHPRLIVELKRNGRQLEVGTITRANTIPMEPGRRKQLKAEGKPELIRQEGRLECIGEITYMPVRVAYATTVHKSQGLSLDKVQININEGFFKSPGMLYVALSRARTVQGLRLVGSSQGLAARCTVNAKVLPWV